jgi:hypothetical protein
MHPKNSLLYVVKSFTKHKDEHANFVGTKNRTELILAHEKLGSQGI